MTRGLEINLSESNRNHKTQNSLRVKPFVKYVNYTHVMPTRYSIPSDLEPKTLVADAQMDTADGRKEAKKVIQTFV